METIYNKAKACAVMAEIKGLILIFDVTKSSELKLVKNDVDCNVLSEDDAI